MRTLKMVLGCAAALAGTLAMCPSALGAQAHYYAGQSFGEAGSGAGQMALVAAPDNNHAGSGLAVSDATHDVYVADTGNRRVDELEANGSFVRAFGWGVENGEAKLQVCTSLSGCRAGLSGANPGEFETPVFVAIDNDPSSPSYQDVYVGDRGDDLVTKFTEAGGLVSSWGNNGSGKEPNGQLNGSPEELFDAGFAVPLDGVAVDNSGGVWVLVETAHLFSFDQAGAWRHTCALQATIGGGGLAFDGSGNLYFGDGFGFVTTTEPNCNVLGRVDSHKEATGLATNMVSTDLFVDGANGRVVEAFQLDACLPNSGGCAMNDLFGEGVLSAGAGLAVDPSSNVVYAANTGVDQIAPFPVGIEATAAPASGVTVHTSVLHGAVNPVGSELVKCRFEYGQGEAFDHSVPCEESFASIGSGSSPVGVLAKVEGLTGTTGYEFRLHVANGHADVRSEAQSFTTTTVAAVEGAATDEVKLQADGTVTAALSAKVNPRGVASTVCRIEYGTTTAYGESVACEPEKPSGSTAVAVSARLEGLSTATAYHWRVAVSDQNGSEWSADQTFAYLTQTPAQRGCENEAVRNESDTSPVNGHAGSLGLSDCRGYELVTPPFKDGALVYIGALGPQPPSIAQNGNQMIATSIQCFDGSQSCTAVRQTPGMPFSFARTNGGWLAEPLAPPASFTGATTITYTADAGRVLYAMTPAEGEPEAFYRRYPDSTLEMIGPLQESPGLAIANEAVSRPLVVTPDLSRLAYDGQGLWAFDSASKGKGDVYEYLSANDHPFLMDVTGSGRESASMIGVCGAYIGGSEPVSAHYGTLSSDGRTAIFTVIGPCATGSGPENTGKEVPESRIYARVEHLDGSMGTALLSGSAAEPQCDASCQAEPPGVAGFQGASADSSRVFFTDTRRLTSNASEDSHSGDTALESGCSETGPTTSGCNLYESECPNDCETETPSLVDISAPQVVGETPRVQGVVAISSDGSHVYFVAKGALTQGANSEGREPLEGGENLYVYERDGEHPSGHLAFIATLPASDRASLHWAEGIGVANVTPDGRFLVFPSHGGLTPDATRSEGPAQVYRYDAQSERLLRVSIGEQGFGDNGNAGTADAKIVNSMKGFLVGGRPDPTMSDDGRYVFFESPTGLTPGALNDHPVQGNSNVLAENVYEWESQGMGGCEEATGCISLISDGHDINEGSQSHENYSAVHLLGSDASGQNVFFETADQLVAQDTDTQVDIYDARVGGGFPKPAVPPVCEAGQAPVGEACRAPTAPGSVFGSPVSLTFSGPGNVASEIKPPGGKPTPRGLTRAQKLKRALAQCRKRYRAKAKRRRRAACEKRARRRYGGKPKRKVGRRKNRK